MRSVALGWYLSARSLTANHCSASSAGARCGDRESGFSQKPKIGRRGTCVPRRHTHVIAALSATPCSSSRNRSSLSCRRSPARLWHPRSGTRPRSTRTGTQHTRRCLSRSSRSSHRRGSHGWGRHRSRLRRARGPVPPREGNCSWENPLCMRKSNRSHHVTTCERGKAGWRSTQFRQTPKRIRAGRIGMARERAA